MSGKTLEIFIHKDRPRNVGCIHYSLYSYLHNMYKLPNISCDPTDLARMLLTLLNEPFVFFSYWWVGGFRTGFGIVVKFVVRWYLSIFRDVNFSTQAVEIYRKPVTDRHHRGAIVSKNYIRSTCRVGDFYRGF